MKPRYELPELKCKPKFEHDCKLCVFLGRRCSCDVYFCQQSGLPTIVARYGHDGSDYSSCPITICAELTVTLQKESPFPSNMQAVVWGWHYIEAYKVDIAT